MKTVPAPIPAAAATVFLRRDHDEDVPLGWECANPALQIEDWGRDEVASASAAASAAAAAAAAAGFVIES